MQAAPASQQPYRPHQGSDDEECLRPSLLRKQRQPKQTSHTPAKHLTEQSENIAPNLKSSTAAKQRAATSTFDSPAQQTPFRPLCSDCPQSAAQSFLSPGAEYELFGTPATPPESNSAFRRRRVDSPTPGKTAGHRTGVSKALAHISQLQKEHAELTKQLEEHKLQQQHVEMQLQNADFLEGQLLQIRGPSTSTTPPAECDGHQSGSALHSANQLAVAEDLEPWQQLSSESSISNEAQQLEELQSQLSLSSQQLQGKESEVVALTIQLVSLHTEVNQTRSQHAETARQLYSANIELAESAEQLKTAQSQCEGLSQQVGSSQQRHTQLLASAANAETALRSQLEERDLQCRSLSNKLEQSKSAVKDFGSQLQQAKQQLQQSESAVKDLGSQMQQAQQQLEQLANTPVQQNSALPQQLREVQAELDSANARLTNSQAATASLSNDLQQAQQQLDQQLAEDEQRHSTLLNQLEKSQAELRTALTSLEQSQAASSCLTNELESARQELNQVFNAHATDESSMMDELSQAQEQLSQAQNQLTGTEAELQHEASQLACSLAEQVDLRGQLEQLRSERHGLDAAHEMAEATLLDQLTQTQAELEQSSTQVRHLQQRHQEMCQQLTFARVGQAQAMQAATASKQQLTQQQQAAQSAHMDSTLELDLLRSQLATAQQQLQHSEFQHAAACKEHSQSGAQKFELSQRLLDAQTQLSRESQHGAHMQARLKKHKAKQHDLRKQLDSAKLKLARHNEQQLEAASGSQQLTDLHAQLERADAELAEARESHVQLQQKAQRESEEAESALSQQLKETHEQQAQLREQLKQKDKQQAQLKEQLQASSAKLDESQAQLTKASADGLALRSQVADLTGQLEQSCTEQAENILEAQTTVTELQAARLESQQLASSLAQADSANEALHTQLKEMHSQGRKFKAKLEQLAVKSARHDGLHRELGEAQAQLAAECAHRQLEHQKVDRVVQRLMLASSNLSRALYNTQPGSPSGQDGARLDLGSTADQVCSLVEALLTNAAPSRPAPPPAGVQAAAASSKPVDALRTYVSEAQARANQIVHEFESMLLVTGAPTGQQATQMQSVAALTASSSDDGNRSHKANSTLSGRRASPAIKAGHTCSTSTCTDAELLRLDAASKKDTWQPTKSSATSSKENRAPALTHVTGGQVRGARKPSAAVRQPLKQSAHHCIAANAIVGQTGEAGWTPAHRSKA